MKWSQYVYVPNEQKHAGRNLNTASIQKLDTDMILHQSVRVLISSI
jgi:hypothetical protein